MILTGTMALWAATTTILYTLILGPAVLLLSLFSKSGRSPYKIGRFWAWLIMKTNGVGVRVEGLEKIDRERSYVFMSNHSSNLDPLAVAWKLSHPLRFIGKQSLEKIPLFGWAARRAKVIFIDRSDSPKSIARINQAIRELRDGISAYFFAEGTRNVAGKLQAFKKGGVVLALKAKLPIVPVTILGGHKLFPKRALRIKPGTMSVIVGDPIDTSPYDEGDRDMVLEKVRSVIFQNLRDHGMVDSAKG
ncbi:MAG: 1-acyl-sn-glycerol-3-phosphate acyltransferase [Syntrophaceae bacterium]|nr:1-acyl-sn-glycerol-3-phosphate acyltransferase [Syntrophaceae bacterium]